MHIYCAVFVGFSALLMSSVGNTAQDITVSFDACEFSQTPGCRSGANTEGASAGIQFPPSRSRINIDTSPAAPSPKIPDQLDIYYSDLIRVSPPVSGISLEPQPADLSNMSPTDFNSVGTMAWIPDFVFKVAWLVAIGIGIVGFVLASRTMKNRNDPTR